VGSANGSAIVSSEANGNYALDGPESMPAQNDDAVVLGLTEFSETSQIASLFSARHGRLRLIAKGARRSTRQRFSPGLDLLERGEVSFVPPRGDAQLGTLTEWVQHDAFAGLRRDLLRLTGGLYAVELVAALTEEAAPHPELFEALVRLLGNLASNAPAAPQIPWFQSELLRAIGYAPSLGECVACHRRVPRGAPAYFSAAAGGLLCRDCEPLHVEKRRIPPSLIETSPATGDSRAWFELLDYHLTHIAGRRFLTAAQLAALLARR
jgi:DNA repair protein RecO (recombination protein O)